LQSWNLLTASDLREYFKSIKLFAFHFVHFWIWLHGESLDVLMFVFSFFRSYLLDIANAIMRIMTARSPTIMAVIFIYRHRIFDFIWAEFLWKSLALLSMISDRVSRPSSVSTFSRVFATLSLIWSFTASTCCFTYSILLDPYFFINDFKVGWVNLWRFPLPFATRIAPGSAAA